MLFRSAELKVLLKHWEETITKVQKATKLPSLVYEETSRTVAMLRDKKHRHLA